jgi:23S rRNA (guanine2445-N2)-methyltransferase / 23S rRNA (guanine2069-N7)-methyltransferase
MTTQHRFFATAPKAMEGLLVAELKSLGAANVQETRAGASFQGDIGTAYRICLWSRIANRVLLPVAEFAAPDPEALYHGVMEVDWSAHLDTNGTLAVDFSTVRSQINHSQFGAQKVKDAIVDQLRRETGERPSVDRERPSLRINVYLHRDQATVNIDLSGDSLHRRGYREQGVEASLKENLAAAILARAGWPEIARQGGSLVDPMCGSGTLPIEAAMMAADIAPGLERSYWGFIGWRQHDAAQWAALMADARRRREKGLLTMPSIRGYDYNRRAVAIARENAERAGLADYLKFELEAVERCPAPSPGSTGLVVVNPPYGERMSEHEALRPVYRALGDCLKNHYEGWRAAVITNDAELGKCIGIRARRIHTLFNGALECMLLQFEVESRWYMGADRPEEKRGLEEEKNRGQKNRGQTPIIGGEEEKRGLTPFENTGDPGAEMFANRLRKNLKQLERWREREGVTCYRAYDADMPEYALAIDIYEAEQRWVVVQEYAAPVSVDPKKAEGRRHAALSVLPEVLEIPPQRVVFKERRRQKGSTQYEKLQSAERFHEVREGPGRFWVNFEDYLDTGLFLDHRKTRALVGELAKGKRFLNLFAYTGTATVYAALGGSVAATTVDMSNTYLEWARRNLELNGIRGRNHEIIRADCTEWLAQAQRDGRRYGLIFLDPPTFSNSKFMEDNFDVQRDHVALIRGAVALLEPDGVLIFSNNFRRFKLDTEALADLAIEDISAATLPPDFERNPKIHRCWKIGPKR